MLTLLSLPEGSCDPGLSALLSALARESVLAAISTDAVPRQPADVAGAAVTLKALLGELLDRLAGSERVS